MLEGSAADGREHPDRLAAHGSREVALYLVLRSEESACESLKIQPLVLCFSKCPVVEIKPRDPKPQVSLSWHSALDHVTVQVVDNGPGLANPANRFVPFYTTKPEGSGIGLVRAQQIATAHKGTLTLSNRVDAPGCIAELRLPLRHT